MNDHEASLEAKKRFGVHAFARRYSEPTEYCVGHYFKEPPEIYGHSEESWEDAFEQANERESDR